MIPDAANITPQFWAGLLLGMLLTPLLMLGLAAILSVMFDLNAKAPKANTDEGNDIW